MIIILSVCSYDAGIPGSIGQKLQLLQCRMSSESVFGIVFCFADAFEIRLSVPEMPDQIGPEFLHSVTQGSISVQYGPVFLTQGIVKFHKTLPGAGIPAGKAFAAGGKSRIRSQTAPQHHDICAGKPAAEPVQILRSENVAVPGQGKRTAFQRFPESFRVNGAVVLVSTQPWMQDQK